MKAKLNIAEVETKAKKEFAESADLQAEFGGDEKAYIAFKKAEAAGQVRIFKKGMSEPGQRKDDLSGGDQQSSADFEAGLKKEFAASADLQAEFGNDEAAYVAFKKAESAGRVGIFKKGTSEPGQSEDDLSGGGQQLSADFEAGLKKEFAESADLQSEFGGKVEYYIAYRKAMAAGRVGHIVMGKVIKSSSKNTEEANSQKQQLPEPNKFSDSNADEETRRFVEENGTPCGPDGGIYDERRNAFVSRPALV